ncbi:MAG TPA: hypothetical protein VF556_05980 [Pyrinomonadaceae bacterium]
MPFFFPLNPLIFLVSPAALTAAWKRTRASRKWLVLMTITGFAVSLVLILYLAPLIASVSRDAENLPADEIIARADIWRSGNRIRLVAEFFGFVCSLKALRVWSAESEN